jgi:hypothetical protein
MMARLPGRPRALSPFRWISYFLAKRVTAHATAQRVADAPEPVRILAHRPLLMSAYGSMEMALIWSRALDPRLKELARHRVGAIHGCPW